MAAIRDKTSSLGCKTTCIWLKNIYDWDHDTAHLSASCTSFASIHHCFAFCTPTNPHTHYIPHLVIWPPPPGAITKRKSKFVRPVLPTFLPLLMLSGHVCSSPRMWKPFFACHLHTVIHITDRKPSCWFPRDLNTPGELQYARLFFTNEAKNVFKKASFKWMHEWMWSF